MFSDNLFPLARIRFAKRFIVDVERRVGIPITGYSAAGDFSLPSESEVATQARLGGIRRGDSVVAALNWALKLTD